MKTKILTIVVAGIVASSLLAAGAPDGTRWWSYVEYLASDKLPGRNTGSEGHRKAAEYVAAQFARDGLKPAGTQGYIQPVKFTTKELDESDSSLTLERDGKEQRLELGEDAIIGTRVDPVPSVDAGLVFVGYGLRVPDEKYDDFAGLDTKGKIAVYLAGAPSSIPSALAAHYQSGGQRWDTLKSAGMIGAIAIANPNHMDVPWPRTALARFQVTMQLAAPGMDETAGEQIAINWNPAHADELLAGSGHTLDELVSVAEAGKQLPRFPLAGKLKARTAVKHGSVVSQNLAAIYEGTDPKLKDEYVVMSAHIDHLGIGKPINGEIRSLQQGNGQRVRCGLNSRGGRPLPGKPHQDEALRAFCRGDCGRKGFAWLAILFIESDGACAQHRCGHQYGHVPAALPF